MRAIEQGFARRLARTGGLVASLAAGLFAGCTVGPDYVAPEAPPAEAPFFYGEEPELDSLARWWRFFRDPVLSELVERGLRSAPSLEAARQRLISARAMRQKTEAGYWPQFTANGGYTWSRGWEGPEATKGWNKRFSASTTASWELDLFGGIRRSVEQAEAEEAALAYTLAELQVALAADIAQAYVEVRQYAAQVEIAEANLALQERNLQRVKRRYESGDLPRYDLATSEAQVSRTRSTLPTLRQSLMAAQLLLDQLVGAAPYATQGKLSETLDQMTLPDDRPKIPENELLRRRADVRAAEETVRAKNAAVGVATATLYPTFALNGTLGVSAPNLSPWNDYTRSLSFGPSVAWNIFGFGTWRRQVEAAEATMKAAVADYQETVLKAYQEAETAWLAYHHETLRTDDLQTTVRACTQALAIADRLYEMGEKDIEDVLTQQSALLTAQENLVNHRANLFLNAITLYKTLGGGWSDPEEAPNN